MKTNTFYTVAIALCCYFLAIGHHAKAQSSPIVNINTTPVTCLGNDGSATAIVINGTQPYHFLWSTGDTTTNIQGLAVGAYGVTVTDANAKVDSLAFTIHGQYDDMRLMADRSIVCQGATTQLHALGAATNSSCNGNNVFAFIGNDTLKNTATTYPAIYGNWYAAAKHQILYKASELHAMGLAVGNINQIGFDVDSVVGTDTYYDFSIMMKEVAMDSITDWVLGASPVFFSSAVNVHQGWNIYTLQVPYYWDGVSDLVMDVCFNNDSLNAQGSPIGGAYTYNSINRVSLTSYPSVVFRAGDLYIDFCSAAYNLSALRVYARPNTLFVGCQGGNANQYSYSWLPSVGLSDSTIAEPIASPTGTTTYQFQVADTSGCQWSQSLTIAVDTVALIPGGPLYQQVCYDLDSVQLSAIAQSNYGGYVHWYQPNGFPSNSYGDTTMVYLAQTYPDIVYATAVDMNSCQVTDTFYIDINPACAIEISGTVYMDVDSNCNFTAIDSALANVLVILDGADSTYTDSLGFYSFTTDTGTHYIYIPQLIGQANPFCNPNALDSLMISASSSGNYDGSFAFKQSGATGIDAYAENQPFSIYPNPANPSINIVSQNDKAQMAGLYNVQGQQVASMALNGKGTYTIATNKLPAGLYVLKLTTDSFTQNHKVQLVH